MAWTSLVILGTFWSPCYVYQEYTKCDVLQECNVVSGVKLFFFFNQNLKGKRPTDCL